MSRQEESDPDPKAIQEIEFAEQFQNIDGVNADGRQTVFVWTILEKEKKNLKFSQRIVAVL